MPATNASVNALALEEDDICEISYSVGSDPFYLHSDVDLIIPESAGNLASTTYFRLVPGRLYQIKMRTGALNQYESPLCIFFGKLKQGRSKMFTN